MEYVKGVNLRQLIVQNGPFRVPEAFDISTQVMSGLEAVHEVGVIHRDLKTANIMQDPRGVVHLMDFGIAKQLGAEGGSSATATGLIVGTPEYMSPEQARGSRAIDLRSELAGKSYCRL
jgi:serine/threonine protein kinase